MKFEIGGVTLDAVDGPILVTDFDPGEAEVRNQDADRPSSDGRLFGRDRLSGPTWTFEAMTTVDDAHTALGLADQVGDVWRRRLGPGELLPLRYELDGRWRRVFGRPRRFVGPDGGRLTSAGAALLLMTYELADPLIYDDTPESLTLTLTGTSGEGVRWPVTFPFVWGSAPGRRDGEVIVGGRAAVPFQLTFHGPSSGSASAFWAQGAGWRVDLNATLAWDQSATVDTRTSTVTRSDGRSLAGDARGRFLTARLQPGAQEIAWGCTDPTNTASMTLVHHAGYHSL